MSQSWEDVRVDDAGYLIRTTDQLKAVVERLQKWIAEPTEDQVALAAELAAAFGPADERRDAAKMCRDVARIMTRLAEQLDGPRVDESDSPLVGADAAHSVG